MQHLLVHKFQAAGLEMTVQREVTFYTGVCVARGYVTFMEKLFGFSYRQVGLFFQKGNVYFFFNKERFSTLLVNWLQKHDIEKELFGPAWKTHGELKNVLAQARIKRAADGLTLIENLYGDYFAFVGIFNGIMRYVGDYVERGSLKKEIVERLVSERDKITRLYVDIDTLVKEWICSVGNIEAGYSLLPDELVHFIEGKTFPDVKNRWEGCVYLMDAGEETVSSDYDEVVGLRETFLQQINANEVRGRGVYEGVVKGTVVCSPDKVKDGVILVRSMTQPKDMVFLGKVAAVVTDEGGILSHVAIMAREFKKPCVMGTKNATKVFKDGDMVEVDANKGIVRKIMG